MKIKLRIFFSLVVLAIYCLLALGSDDGSSQQKETLKRATEKAQTGAPMTNEEKSTYNSYKKWEKEYDAEQYNKEHYN